MGKTLYLSAILAILSSLAFHTRVRPEDIRHEGITKLSIRDFRYARELGFAIKLLAIAKQDDKWIEVRSICFISEESQLAKWMGFITPFWWRVTW
jgi:homoserine dehydrogenase